MRIDPEIKSICNNTFKNTCNPGMFGLAALAISVIDKINPIKSLSSFRSSVKIISHVFSQTSLIMVGALTVGVMFRILCFKKTKSIEAESMKNISNGIVLDIKCSHDSDHNGAFDYNHHDLMNSKIYAKKYAVISKRVSDDDSVLETFSLIDEYSRKGPIKVLIISGHGTSNSVIMGSRIGDKICKFYTPQIEKAFAKTDDQAVIILNSCSASAGTDNLATNFRSAAGERKVYASTKKINAYIIKENSLSDNKNFPYNLYFIAFDKFNLPWIKQE